MLRLRLYRPRFVFTRQCTANGSAKKCLQYSANCRLRLFRGECWRRAGFASARPQVL